MFLTEIIPLGSFALFAADDGVHGEELWRTDGTAAGTAMVRDIIVGSYPSSPRDLTRVGESVFFSAEAVGSGREIWVSNGTPGGTRRVADVVPGAGSSVPQELAAIRDELWFSAWTLDFGREPWRARRAGGAWAVERLADVAPGPLSSSPLIFRNAGADVFTVANDNVHGFELWKLRDPDLLFADDFESSGTALWASATP
jgi:ELWxxDGT repeat protein